jgi:hypothetical protein
MSNEEAAIEEDEETITSKGKKKNPHTQKKDRFPNLTRILLDDREFDEEQATIEEMSKDDDEDLVVIEDTYDNLKRKREIDIQENYSTNEDMQYTGKGKKKRKNDKSNINENKFNMIDRVNINITNEKEKQFTEDKQRNMIIAEKTTQANINSYNISRNILKNGKIKRNKTNSGNNLKLNIRGLITEKSIQTIKNKINCTQININELTKILNTYYIVGTIEILKIYKLENAKLRESEGINIKGRYPRLIEEVKDPP